MNGRKVTFIRQSWPNGDHAPCKNEQFEGIILDKINGWDIIEGKRYRANFYLVELANGVIGKFFCDEAVSIKRENELL